VCNQFAAARYSCSIGGGRGPCGESLRLSFEAGQSSKWAIAAVPFQRSRPIAAHPSHCLPSRVLLEVRIIVTVYSIWARNHRELCTIAPGTRSVGEPLPRAEAAPPLAAMRHPSHPSWDRCPGLDRSYPFIFIKSKLFILILTIPSESMLQTHGLESIDSIYVLVNLFHAFWNRKLIH
jgi:hypothetical protein